MEILIILFLLGLGWFFGKRAEGKHFDQLLARERALCSQVVTTQTRRYMAPAPQGKPPMLLMAETVVASDYLKSFLARMRNIFGGEVKSFETLLERARREVTVQLQEQAAAKGYNAVCNVRLNTAAIGGMGAKAAAMASIIGWATAYDTTVATQERPPGPQINHLA